MCTAIEISLYPLDAHYIPPIKSLIDRLNTYPEVQVTTNVDELAQVYLRTDGVPFFVEELVCCSGVRSIDELSPTRSATSCWPATNSSPSPHSAC